MGLSMGHLILLLVIVLVVFGAGKIPQIMGDVAKGLKAFKKGMKDEENETSSDSDFSFSTKDSMKENAHHKDATAKGTTPAAAVILEHEEIKDQEINHDDRKYAKGNH